MLFLVLLLSYLQNYSQKYTIEFEIKNIQSDKGNIMAALYNCEENFISDDKTYSHQIVKAKKGKIKVKFDNIPAGNYAVAVYHDVNSNKKLDKNVVGMPKEAYGFSNNARVSMGPPKYDDAKFIIKGNFYSEILLSD
jgi:uncharacterized protein (DUF2141 family)